MEEKIKLLRKAVSMQVAAWQILRSLEVTLLAEGEEELSTKACEAMSDHVSTLAVECRTPNDAGWIGEGEVTALIDAVAATRA